MSDDVQRTLGEHDADIASIKKQMADMANDVKVIRSAVDQGTGGWKAIMLLSSVSVTVGTAIGWLLSHLSGSPVTPP